MSTIWEVDDADEEIEGLDAAGRADPAYAAALGLIPAPFGRRSVAVTIDVLVYLLVQIPYWAFSVPLLLMFARSDISLYGLVNHPNFFLAALMAGISALLTAALLIIQGAFQGRAGVTIGKGIVGIRSVNVERLAKPGFWRIVLRTLIVALSNIIPVVGPAVLFSSALRDPEQRGRAWHDHATHVWLVDIKKGLDPYDAKRMRIARKVVKVEVVPQASALPSLATAANGGALPEYRPAHTVSAGVLGVAKSRGRGGQDAVGVTSQSTPMTPPPAGERDGAAVVGGYRGDRRMAEQRPAPATPGADHRVVLGVPAGIAANTPPPPAGPAAPAPAGSAGPAAVRVPQEVVERPVEVVERQVEVVERPVEAVERHTRIAVRLILDTGSEHVLDALAVFGRNPESDASSAAAVRVPVADDTRSVSKTHFALRPLPGGVEVRDLGSTNGTFILRGGVETQVASGASLMAAPGDVVRFGDRTMRIDAS